MSSFLSQSNRFSDPINGHPGPGTYHDISKSKKKLMPVPEVPFKVSEQRFKKKEESVADKARRQKLIKYLNYKDERLEGKKLNYVNQTSSFSSGVDRFDKKLEQAPPLTKYQPKSFTEKLVRKIGEENSKREIVQEKKYFEDKAKQEARNIKPKVKKPKYLDGAESKAQMDEMGFMNGGKFQSIIKAEEHEGSKKKDFQYVSDSF